MSHSLSTFGSRDAVLIVSDGTADSAAFHLLGAYTGGEFRFASDGYGGTAITLARAS
jgi:hypothetical protein